MNFSKLEMLFKIPSTISYHLWTLFLFTKADIKGIVIPMTVLTIASTPLSSFSRLLQAIFWLWLTVLQCDLPNQTLSRIEDEKNKRDRPIPSGRISFEATVKLRWAVVPVCLAVSACYSLEIVYATAAGCVLTYLYNEKGVAAGHWLARDTLIAVGYGVWGAGACLIAGENPHELSDTARTSLLYCMAVVVTTIHAEDFKDIVGDTLVGRKTLPIVAPNLARYSFPFLVIGWSTILSMVWKLSVAASVAYVTLGLLVGWRFIAYNSVKADQRSFYLYSLWITLGFALPVNVHLISAAY